MTCQAECFVTPFADADNPPTPGAPTTAAAAAPFASACDATNVLKLSALAALCNHPHTHQIGPERPIWA